MKKAIVVGGSMAGMLAGNMLIRQGWDVEILERSREGLEARGAGIRAAAVLTCRARSRRRHCPPGHWHPHRQARGV